MQFYPHRRYRFVIKKPGNKETFFKIFLIKTFLPEVYTGKYNEG